MPIRCGNCGQLNLRASRLRSQDALRLLVLQYPVRCRDCYERGYAFVLDALRLRPDRIKPRDDPHPGQEVN